MKRGIIDVCQTLLMRGGPFGSGLYK